ncbi:MAG: alanine--tRNA ligase [Nannocystaceae bacterium]
MEPLNAHAIRRRFLSFFAERGHAVVPSASLVPRNDPTLLFTNAGMVQFKDVFVGRDERSYSRATSVQRCLRAGGKHNDLDNVGFTPRHHTFFEMLGNFSFGDYFKRDAIRWAWELLTEGFGIPARRLCVSIFNGEGEAAPLDQEAFDLWAELVPRDRIYAFPAKENFWQMGDTGPCGPCTEIHIFHGDEAPPDAAREGRFGPAYEDTRYTELWNLVFMQFEKLADGSMIALPKPSVDTGAGLERIAAVVEGASSNYGTSLLAPLVARAKELAGVDPKSELGQGECPFRVIADHARATAFLIADGVFPDRAGRSYVLRRIMRRAIRYGASVGLSEPFFHEITRAVISDFGDDYPELREGAATIDEVVRAEEESFRRTLSRGLRRLEVALSDLTEGTADFPPAIAADLYDTYGFPIDLTGVICREHKLGLDEDAVETEVHRRQQHGDGEGSLSSERRVDDHYFAVGQRLTGRSRFVGYEAETVADAVIPEGGLIVDGRVAGVAQIGQTVEFIADRTPFYAESGGQVGDAGWLSGPGVEVAITDTVKPTGDLHFHRGVVREGTLLEGATYRLEVDHARRTAIRRNHSATHLLHFALRQVLGGHVVQKGSLVAHDRLRFDFSHGRPLTAEQRREIERIVNAEVLRNQASSFREMHLTDAKGAGAIGLFGEKYGDVVRVVAIGSESVELCGGTHVAHAGDIGLFTITSEAGVAQGVRRIEAVTGMSAVEHVQATQAALAEVAELVHAAGLADVPERVRKVLGDLKAQGKEIADLQRKLTTGGRSEDAPQVIEGVKLLAKQVEIADPKTLREAADALRDRLGSGVVILGASEGAKATILVAVTRDLAGSKIHAGKLAQALAVHVDGKGGGRPDLAQAGGPGVGGLPKAITAAPAALAEQLRG